MARYINVDKLINEVLASWVKDNHRTLEASRVHRQEHHHLMSIIEKQPIVKVAPKSEATTLYERIKAMSLEEMASFFVYLAEKKIIVTADNFICRKCKAEHGGDCPLNDENCLYDLDAKATIMLWLEGEGDGYDQ